MTGISRTACSIRNCGWFGSTIHESYGVQSGYVCLTVYEVVPDGSLDGALLLPGYTMEVME